MKIGVFGDSFADRTPYNPESPFKEDESWIADMESAGHKITSYGKTGTSTWYSFQQFIAHCEQFDHIVFCYSSLHRMHHLPDGLEDLSFLTTPDELYSLRRKIASITSKDESLDIYGLKWNSGKFYDYLNYFYKLVSTPINLIDLKSLSYLGITHPNYAGISQNKKITYSNYRIFLILENSIEYVSEKLFDAAAARGIIIYIGANISQYNIPPDAVIQIEPDAIKIHSKIVELQNLSTDEQYQIMENQQRAILSISKSWYCVDVLKQLANDISKEIAPYE